MEMRKTTLLKVNIYIAVYYWFTSLVGLGHVYQTVSCMNSHSFSVLYSRHVSKPESRLLVAALDEYSLFCSYQGLF